MKVGCTLQYSFPTGQYSAFFRFFFWSTMRSISTVGADRPAQTSSQHGCTRSYLLFPTSVVRIAPKEADMRGTIFWQGASRSESHSSFLFGQPTQPVVVASLPQLVKLENDGLQTYPTFKSSSSYHNYSSFTMITVLAALFVSIS